MSQGWQVEEIVPGTTSPATDIVKITDALLALKSKFSGASLPTTNLYGGMEVVLNTGARWLRNSANDAWVAAGNINLQTSGIADINSAATIDLTSYGSGTTAIVLLTTATSAFTMNDDQHMTLVAAAAWPLTYHATNCNIIGGANYTCKAGQKVELFKAGGVVFVFPYGVVPAATASREAVPLGQLTDGSALNGQIKFPATQNPSADANTLDDYEEGTFTATLTGCTTSPTIDFKYTKVGRVVTVTPLATSVNGVSNSTSKTLTGVPLAISPAVSYYDHAISSDNGGAATMSACLVGSGGVWSLQPNTNSASWTASGGCAWYPKSYSWSI